MDNHMILTCFVCNATGSIEAFTKDDAAGEFVNLAGNLQPAVWRALLAYVGLFRTSRKIPFERALKLAREVLALDGDVIRLETALCETVESLRSKGGKPLKNHNYLKRVLENQPHSISGDTYDIRGHVSSTCPRISPEYRQGGSGKRAQALVSLREWAGDDWLRTGIAQGLQALVAQSLKGQPAAEMIALNADIWHASLKRILTIEEVDLPRLMKGFEILIPRLTEWPQPKQLLEVLPKRPNRQKLPEPPLSAEALVSGREAIQKIKESLK